ncbi:MAG: hypothetical protein IJK67_02080 [Bacilli bacterium]|jgi:hypothetical protein|nr:hypothetical protein [Bacilli bacterium]
MKYVIDKNNEKMKLMYYSVKLVGLDVEPKNDVKNLKIKAKKVVIVDPELRESYIKQRINKKIDKVIDFMLKILNDDGTSDDDAGMVLDEINKLKGIIINKYKEHMKITEYKTLLTKLIMIEEEFKKNYNQKMFSNYMQNVVYEEVRSEGRGR